MNEYTLKYDLFLAEQDMFREIIAIGACESVVESVTELHVVQEALKESVQKYVKKVIEGLQKAWNKFKEAISKVLEGKILQSAKEKINNFNGSFKINNYPTVDMQAFDNIDIVPFNYENMKDSLDNKESFIKTHLKNIYFQGQDLKESIRNKVITGNSDVVADKTLLNSIYDFCTDNFNRHRKSLEDDITNINNSSTNINNQMNTIIDAEYTPISASANMLCKNIYLRALSEADDQDKNELMTFQDRDGEVTNPNDSKANDEKQSFLKRIGVYFGVMCDIIATKLELLLEIMKNRMSVIRHFLASMHTNNAPAERQGLPDNTPATVQL